LIGHLIKVQEKLGWKPKYTLKEVVKVMNGSFLNAFKKQQILISNGFHAARQYE
jgi:GDPmannose 4,6-dehydratase